MRTQRRQLTHFPVFVLVHRDRQLRQRMQHAAFPRGEIFNVCDIGLEEALVLHIDLHVVGDLIGDPRKRRDAVGFVDRGPLVGETHDFIGDESAGDDAVREAVAVVARADVDVGLALVPADEGGVIDGFEGLAGPFVVHAAGVREAGAHPGFEFGEAVVGWTAAAFLANFVVVAADEEVVVFFVAGGLAEVVVRVCGIVEGAVFDGVLGDADGDAVGAEEFQFGDDGEFLQGDASGLDGVDAGDGLAAFGADADFLGEIAFFFDGHDAGVCVAFEVDVLGEVPEDAKDVFGGVKCSLMGVREDVSLVYLAIPTFDREAMFVFGFDAQLAHLPGFLLELFNVIFVAVLSALVLRDVVAGEKAVFALNAKFFGDLAYAVNRVGMAFDG